MCGIAAAVSVGGSVEPMELSRLQHRGPDGKGEWLSPDRKIWLGNTRLAIIDLSPTGAQPMIDPATGNVIVLNGEIYNHNNVRLELAKHNPHWRGTSDTESLLAAYRAFKEEMVGKIKGMFAFVLHDASDGSIFVARDRLGIKPLYYVQDSSGFRFASETRLLVTGHNGDFSKEAISLYLQWGACPEELLLPRNISVFPAGHWMRLRKNGTFELKQYWPSQTWNHVRANATTSSPAKQVRMMLERSVEEHLLSDVPVASFLSGGLDSSIVTALAAQKYKGILSTFSVGFREKRFDETEIAGLVAQRWKTDHHRIELSEEETLGLVKEAVTRMDLPSVDAINTYVVSKTVARKGIKVALSGLGGDELFGGYPSFRDVPRLRWLARVPRFFRKSLSVFGGAGERIADLPSRKEPEVLAYWRRKFWTDTMVGKAGLPIVPIQMPAIPHFKDDFSKVSWIELTAYMRHTLLRDSDQMSMAVSLELRVPFLDHEFVEFVLSLPASEKKRNRRSKGLLIEACRDLIPPQVYERKKMGFTLPMREWMLGPLAPFVEEGLRECLDRRIIESSALGEFKGLFVKGRLHWTRLWSLIVLGHYARNQKIEA